MTWTQRFAVSALALALLAPLPLTAQSLKIDVPLDELQESARRDSADAVAHYNLALGYWSKKRWTHADSALDRAISLEPRFALAHLAKAYLPFARRPKLWQELAEDDLDLEQRNALQEMERAYRRAFFFDPLVDLRIVGATIPGKSYLWSTDPYLSSIYDTWVQGFEDFRDADYESAYRRFDRMIELFTSTGRRDLSRVPIDIVWLQALAAAHLGRFDAALENGRVVLERMLELEREEQEEQELTFAPLRANEYRYVLGVLSYHARDYENAIRYFEEAATNDLGLYMAHVHLANIYQSRRQLDAAVAARRAALAANPEDVTSAIELAITLSQTGALAEAEQLLAEAARTNPLSARAHYLLGILYQGLGRPAEARTALETFLQLVPTRFTNEIADAKGRLARLP